MSKERIGIELGGMLRAQHPLSALEDIFHYGFWNIIFCIPEGSDLKDKEYIASIPELGFSLMVLGLEWLSEQGLKT